MCDGHSDRIIPHVEAVGSILRDKECNVATRDNHPDPVQGGKFLQLRKDINGCDTLKEKDFDTHMENVTHRLAKSLWLIL